MATKTLYMETTDIAPEKTATEITSLLVKSGARQIAMEYGPIRPGADASTPDPRGREGARPVGLRFSFLVQEIPVTFALPVRVDPIFRILNGRRPNNSWERGNRSEKAMQDHAQAERVAWRQLLRWVQAQLAMVDTGMVQAQEVFLPYLLYPGTQQTVFEYFQGEGFKQLPAGAGSSGQ